MGKKSDLSEHGIVVGVKWAALGISETTDLLGFSCKNISRFYRELSKKEKISGEPRLNTTAYIVANHVHPFITAVYTYSDGCLQQVNVLK